jgi:hypothetical protein
MFQVLLVPTNKIIAILCSSQRDAQAEAIKAVKEHLRTTPHGRRLLAWCNQNVTWKVAASYVVIQEMVGVWIDTNGGRVLPEDIEDDELILYRNGKGVTLLGTYCASANEFTDNASEHTLSGDRVTAFMIIPEN